MKYVWIAFGIAVFTFAAVIIGLQKGSPTAPNEDGRIQIAATIYPLYDMVREVAGEYADVNLIVPPGASPHFFEFSPRQLQDLQTADTLFEIGHGIDRWASRLEAIAPTVQRVILDKGIVLRNEASHEEETENNANDADEDTSGIDPHYWLHFGNARVMVSTIAERLAAIDPIHAPSYRENAARYQDRLSEKEQEMISLLASVRGKEILTLHDAWYYFSDNLGLVVAGTFEPAAGGEPTPRYLANLRAKIKEYGISVLFSEPQLATPSLSAFAQDERLRLGILDPIGGVEGRMTFMELMEYNARSILAAFSAL
ncbi:zinc ABC transporter substrate-binding protein [Candidatus Uhrbacteria bacterium]|nr:zinc ABC transporter substrate-binding protein [Candidatus Uhrbacteria bacterium]